MRGACPAVLSGRARCRRGRARRSTTRFPTSSRAVVRVGAIVRVPLHGRRVRGWVVADDVESEVDDRDACGRSSRSRRPARPSRSSRSPRGSRTATAARGSRCCGARRRRTASRPDRLAGAARSGGARRRGRTPAPTPNAKRSRSRPRSRDDDVAAVRWPPLLDRRLLVARLLAAEGSSIVVVADAAPRALARRSGCDRAGARAVLVHSDLSDAERTRAWATAAAGRVVVVGGRVAAFAPVPDLARRGRRRRLRRGAAGRADADVARARSARRAGRGVRARVSPVVSAAPSVEAEVLAGLGRTRRPGRSRPRAGRASRSSTVVRSRRAPACCRSGSPRALHEARDAGAPAVCVLNRRGRVRLLACATCRAARALGSRRRAGVGSARRRAVDDRLGARRRGPTCARTAAGPGCGCCARVSRACARSWPRCCRARRCSRSTPRPTRSTTVECRRCPRRHRSGAATGRGAPAPPGARRVPRLRPGAARAAVARRRSRRCGWSCGRRGSSPGTTARRRGVLLQTRTPDHEVVRGRGGRRPGARRGGRAGPARARSGSRRSAGSPRSRAWPRRSMRPPPRCSTRSDRLGARSRSPRRDRACARARRRSRRRRRRARRAIPPARALGRLHVEVDPAASDGRTRSARYVGSLDRSPLLTPQPRPGLRNATRASVPGGVA